MRYVVFGCGLATLIGLAGCNSFGFLRSDPQGEVGLMPSMVPSKESLVKYLNDNAERVQTLRCDELDLTCSMGIQRAGLSGKMMCQRPRNFQMSAMLLGKTQVELGSNEQEFWYWLRQGDPYQFHCTYKDLNEGKVRRLPFPFQPEWAIESLGLGTYGTADQYELDTRDRETLRLVARSLSPQGTPVRKVIVFSRRDSMVAKTGKPQVTDFLLLDDATNKEICAAHISQVQVDRATGAILPFKVDMRWPEMKMRMSMRFDSVAVNPNPPINPALAFQRRPLTGVPGFDLATMRPDGSLQRVQGYER